MSSFYRPNMNATNASAFTEAGTRPQRLYNAMAAFSVDSLTLQRLHITVLHQVSECIPIRMPNILAGVDQRHVKGPACSIDQKGGWVFYLIAHITETQS